MRSLEGALVLAVLAQGALALAEELPPTAAPESTAHRHLGFFLRLDTGPGYEFASEPYQGSSASLTGGAWDFGFSIGGALAEDNILTVHLYSLAVFNPSISYSPNKTLGNANSVFYLEGVGPEFTHYFMPANVYLSAALLLSEAVLNNAQSNSGGGVSTTLSKTYVTDLGVGLKLAVGKEWWVGDHWGLGIALHYAISWNHDSAGIVGSSTLATNAFTIDFCATYN
jgi:hypothetical protein